MTCFVVGQIDILQFFCFVVKIFAYVEECGQQDQTKDRTQKWPCLVTTFHHVGHRAIVIEQIDSPSTLILQGQSILTQNTTLLITFLVDQLVFQCIKGRENDCFGRVEWKRTIVHQVRALVTKKQEKNITVCFWVSFKEAFTYFIAFGIFSPKVESLIFNKIGECNASRVHIELLHDVQMQYWINVINKDETVWSAFWGCSKDLHGAFPLVADESKHNCPLLFSIVFIQLGSNTKLTNSNVNIKGNKFIITLYAANEQGMSCQSEMPKDPDASRRVTVAIVGMPWIHIN